MDEKKQASELRRKMISRFDLFEKKIPHIKRGIDVGPGKIIADQVQIKARLENLCCLMKAFVVAAYLANDKAPWIIRSLQCWQEIEKLSREKAAYMRKNPKDAH